MQDLPGRNETLLVHDLSKGNLFAFNYLYNIYSRRLYRFSYGYLKSDEEAKELVQEVFTIVWEKRKKLKENLSFKSFLFTIAFNIIRKHFRTKAYLNRYINAEYKPAYDSDTSNKLIFDSLNGFILELVNQLPLHRREIFIKSRYQGHSIKEIAEDLKISHKTVENQLTSALKFIRTNINREKFPVKDMI